MGLFLDLAGRSQLFDCRAAFFIDHEAFVEQFAYLPSGGFDVLLLDYAVDHSPVIMENGNHADDRFAKDLRLTRFVESGYRVLVHAEGFSPFVFL